MPQLDALTYFTQFFWFIIIFLGFYLILSDEIIPAIALILKSKYKTMMNTVVSVNSSESKTSMEKKISDNLINNK